MSGISETDELRDVLREFCKDNVSSQTVRTAFASESGVDLGLWQRLCTEVGLTEIRSPGANAQRGDLLTVAVVLEELGRALAPVPVLSAVVATELLLRCGTDPARELLVDLADGTALPVLSRRAGGREGRSQDELLVERTGPRTARVSGLCRQVLDGQVGTDLIVAVTESDGPVLLRVSVTTPEVSWRPRMNLDGTRRQTDVHLKAAAAAELATGADATAAIATAALVGATGVAAESVGGMEALVQMAAEHARQRYQFGRPIGSFQAVKHMCADMLVSLELSRSLVLRAVHELSSADNEAGNNAGAEAVAMAKAYCSDAYVATADTTLQVHGGMGYTWEHDCHLFLRRAKTNQTLWGAPRHHRAEIARLNGLIPLDA